MTNDDNMSLAEVVQQHPFEDYNDWWQMGSLFIGFMSDAIVSQWRALPHMSGDVAQVQHYTDVYHNLVFGKRTSKGLVARFMEGSQDRVYYSGEFDALSYAFYRSAFEQIAAHPEAYDHSVAVERRRFTARVGAAFFAKLDAELTLALPAHISDAASFVALQQKIDRVGAFLSEQGYLRDNFDFRFNVHVDYNGEQIDQTEGEFLAAMSRNKTGYALYEMGYPVILPSAVYLYKTIGEAQHHSSRIIEELFKHVGYSAREVDDFDPTGYPSDSVIELWEIVKD